MTLALLNPAALAENRSLNGSGNNVANPQWGAINTPLLREASGAHYADGIWAPNGDSRPSARVISNALSAEGGAPILDPRGLTTLASVWGQFVTHDMDLRVDKIPLENFYVPVPMGDSHFDPFHTGDQTIIFYRSECAAGTGMDAGNPCQQLNRVTTWIDGSVVYGSTASRANWLRAGAGGRLKVTSHATGDLLPMNDETQVMDAANGQTTDPSFFVAGDDRANQQAGLIAMHTLFVREHNYQAAALATAHPDWTDEQIFQRARKIVAAEIQSVTYNQFLPALLGSQTLPAYSGYDPQVNPSISNAFSTAGFRVAHSMSGSIIPRIDMDGNEIPEGNLTLRHNFFNPAAILNEGGIDPVLRGLATQIEQKIDLEVIDDLRNLLFGPPGAGGLDLASLDIQRGRDHGLADYNTMRADFGLPRVTSFAQISADPLVQAALAGVYSSVDDIDSWIGAMAEDHLPGSSVGPLVAAIVTDQFRRLRDGDRFYFENDSDFSADQIAALRNTTLADIMMRNASIPHGAAIGFIAVPEPSTVGFAALVAAFALFRLRCRKVA
jgi:hypothetical protein